MGQMAESAPGYHERQRLQQCLLHTLNNLFQQRVFDSVELDGIANQLAPGRLPILHPHRTLFLGNWDVNVMELALRRHGKKLHWCDLRDLSFAHLDLDACWGLLLNVKGEGALSRILGGRHWLALKSFGGRWWDLDSTLPAPQPIGSSSCAAAVSVGSRVEGSDLHAEASGSSGNGGSDTHHAGHATEDGEAAAAAAAVRHWLAEKVQQRDAKVFRITECPLASHPLPDARDCASSDM